VTIFRKDGSPRAMSNPSWEASGVRLEAVGSFCQKTRYHFLLIDLVPKMELSPPLKLTPLSTSVSSCILLRFSSSLRPPRPLWVVQQEPLTAGEDIPRFSPVRCANQNLCLHFAANFGRPGLAWPARMGSEKTTHSQNPTPHSQNPTQIALHQGYPARKN
jgi:hypothetical protein